MLGDVLIFIETSTLLHIFRRQANAPFVRCRENMYKWESLRTPPSHVGNSMSGKPSLHAVSNIRCLQLEYVCIHFHNAQIRKSIH